jgi:GAF domain-containing protein
MHTPLPRTSTDEERRAHYDAVMASIASLLEDETDWVAAMATVACELHHAFEYYHWTGFYRTVAPQMLAVGPYQGGHGCLRIPFSRGVCGAAARTQQTQFVPDVHAFADHIACSSSTLSEVVVPILDLHGDTIAVLDIDSDDPAVFTHIDRTALETLCFELGQRYGR